MADMTAGADPYREQHKNRMSWMPWLYHSLKPELRAWAETWQEEVQGELMRLEAVTIGNNCFVAPTAAVFAEPRRPVTIGDDCSLAAESFLHGPVTLGRGVSINHRTRNVPAWAIVAGVPARVIKDRRGGSR